MNTKENIISGVESWCNGLSESERNETAVLFIVGDMGKKQNVDLVYGSEQNLVLTLAQSMLNDKDIYKVTKEALSLYDKFIDSEVKKAEAAKKNTPKKIVS